MQLRNRFNSIESASEAILLSHKTQLARDSSNAYRLLVAKSSALITNLTACASLRKSEQVRYV